MWNNADEISKISPYKIIYDMQYHFARNPKAKRYSDKFSSCFTHQDRAWFYDGSYKTFNAQNQVLLHGLAYKRVLDFYKKYLNPVNADNLTLITKSEYNKMPKRYRSAFRPYSDDYYKLNASSQPIVFYVRKEHKILLEKLLDQAEHFISVIYKEQNTKPDIDMGGFEIFEGNGVSQTTPAFVPDSIHEETDSVTNEQISTVHKLHSIFMDIAQISTPFDTKYNELQKGGAWKLYQEYIDEQNRKNKYTNAIKDINKKKLEAYNLIHQAKMKELKENFLVNCK